MRFTAADVAKFALSAAALLTIVGTLTWGSTNAQATERPSIDSGAYDMPMAAESSGWQFRATPYVWIPGVSGDVAVRGNPVNIDFNVFDVFDSGSSGVDLDSLAALMGYLEISKGRWSVYGDLIWGNFGLSGDAVSQRNPTANLTLSAGANAGLDYETTIVESGVAYEVANWSRAQSSTALDLLGGARYWNQQLDLSLAVTGAVDFGRLGLERSGSRAVARSGTIDWVDPFVGFRVRHELSPGQELQFLGDVGGFGVGSDFSWQLFAGYSFDFSVWQSTLHGLVGYRALAVDYSDGNGTNANSIDLVLHGPVAGLSFRW
jgi:hypothetical protein